jgi:hypothetical protein
MALTTLTRLLAPLGLDLSRPGRGKVRAAAPFPLPDRSPNVAGASPAFQRTTLTNPLRLLESWLERQLDPAGHDWLQGQLARISEAGQTSDLHKTLGLAPRRLGKADLTLSADDLRDAHAARPGWDPTGWSVDDAARIAALLRFAERAADFSATFTELCRSADVGEAVALYRGLPLYPAPEKLDWQVGEGLRTAIRAVFEAIAHKSPYPREHFSQERWNHMVLKALFIGSTLHPIQGLDERANAELAAILSDYAHERWAAGRPVTPELWRCMGPFAEGIMMDDLAKVAESADRSERRAAALALSASPDARAGVILERLPEETTMVKTGRLSWDSLAA